MMQGLYISATGLKTHSAGLQVVSHNIANVSTVAYKQQAYLFQDLMYQEVPTGAPINVAQSKKGLGSTLEAVRTNHSLIGAFEPGNAATDLAIAGKGFFQVTDDAGQAYYTRAGNFRFDADGTLRNPQGLSVSGLRIGSDGNAGNTLEAVSINFGDPGITTSPAQATTMASLAMNINAAQNNFNDDANPYFSMLSAWDATQTSPLAESTQSIPITVYDAEGNRHELTLHFDAATTDNGRQTIEYILSMDPATDGRADASGTAGAGLLMAGTMTFSTSGQLVNLSAFTPGSGDLKDLSNWAPASLVNGVPQISLNFAGQPGQTISLNLGASGDGWSNNLASAADVGTVLSSLPGLSNVSFSSRGTTGLPKSTALSSFNQDGFSVGDLYDLYVAADGMVTAEYSNGQSRNLFQIPLCRFTSEDGLRNEGNNLYAATKDSGNMSFGTAGTENYGEIQCSYLETSNVDMSNEMVSMIILQRGFQSNSKAITTWDTMIQKALELKRQ